MIIRWISDVPSKMVKVLEDIGRGSGNARAAPVPPRPIGVPSPCPVARFALQR